MFVYIAGPYTKGDVVINVREAIITGDVLRSVGFSPFIPHLTHFWHMLKPHGIQYWYDYDMEWLSKCDALIRLPGESTGADAEEARARKLGIPVFYTADDLLKWRKDRNI